MMFKTTTLTAVLALTLGGAALGQETRTITVPMGDSDAAPSTQPAAQGSGWTYVATPQGEEPVAATATGGPTTTPAADEIVGNGEPPATTQDAPTTPEGDAQREVTGTADPLSKELTGEPSVGEAKAETPQAAAPVVPRNNAVTTEQPAATPATADSAAAPASDAATPTTPDTTAATGAGEAPAATADEAGAAAKADPDTGAVTSGDDTPQAPMPTGSDPDVTAAPVDQASPSAAAASDAEDAANAGAETPAAQAPALVGSTAPTEPQPVDTSATDAAVAGADENTAAASGVAPAPATEEGGEAEHAAAGTHEQQVTDVAFSFEGPFGTFDQFQLQRGLQVYTEVCSACHGLRYVPIRTLGDAGGPGLPRDQVNAYAATMDIDDPETGETRPRKGTDNFPHVTAAAAPDLSVMAKARAAFHGPYGTGVSQLFNGIGGPEYIYSVLTHYTGETKEEAGETYYENTAFPGGWIKMPPPLSDDLVTYEDGHPATVADQAEDLSAFLMWTAEPKMMARKQVGAVAVIFLLGMTILLYFTNKRLWWSLKHGRRQD